MLTHIFIISTIVFAIHYTMQEGEIFGVAQKINLGKFADPLRDCPVCMVPWYGSLVFYFLFPGSFGNWFLTIIPALGLNAILIKLFPDKDTPGIHQELGEISEGITDIGQNLQHSNELFKQVYPPHPVNDKNLKKAK